MDDILFGHDVKINMCLHHAIVSGVPVYESLDIATDSDEGRVAFTRLLCELGGSLYVGGDSIGNHFKLRSLALLRAMIDLWDDEDSRAARKMKELLPRMDRHTLSDWIDALLEKHSGELEIELFWKFVNVTKID